MLDYNGMLSTWSVILTLRSDSSYMGSVFGYPIQKKIAGIRGFCMPKHRKVTAHDSALEKWILSIYSNINLTICQQKF